MRISVVASGFFGKRGVLYLAIISLVIITVACGIGATKKAHNQLPVTPSFARYQIAQSPTGGLILLSREAYKEPNGPFTFRRQMWLLNNRAQGWYQPSVNMLPDSTDGAALVYDGATNTDLLFGGIYEKSSQRLGHPLSNSTWEWNGVTWNKLPIADPPPARSCAGMAYDSATGQVVMYGGFTPLPITTIPRAYSDTWIWKDGTWSQVQIANGPPALACPAMAYDPNLGQVILYGGFLAGDTLSPQDLSWLWDGTTWHLGRYPINPPPDYWPSLGYDFTTGQLVMSAESSTEQIVLSAESSGDGFGDNWVFNGRIWQPTLTQLMENSPKFPLSSPTIAWSSALNALVAVGLGTDHNRERPMSTWEWKGLIWNEIKTLEIPDP